jgi:hypothetical protein
VFGVTAPFSSRRGEEEEEEGRRRSGRRRNGGGGEEVSICKPEPDVERKKTGTRVPARAEQIVSSVAAKLQNTVFGKLHFSGLPWINTNFL